MNNAKIKRAFEDRVKAMADPLATAWENLNFKPVAGQPYQVVDMLFARPENPTMGDDFYRQRGYLQVALQYPQNTGAGDALERAEAIQAWFHRGLSLTVDGVTAIVEKTPEIGRGNVEGDRYVIRVVVPFFANLMGA